MVNTYSDQGFAVQSYVAAPAGYPSDAPNDYPGGAPAGQVGLIVNWAAALVSILLIIGVSIWAWQLLTRDVTQVPVIQAMDTPMRVAPEDPGGAVAENQGLAVNRLAEGAEAAPVPDQLVVAPDPIDLSQMPTVAEIMASADAEQPAPTDPAQPVEIAPVAEAPAPDLPAPSADTDAIMSRILAENAPLDPVNPPAARALPSVDQPVGDTPQLTNLDSSIPISIPGVRRSPRPVARPAGLSARAAIAPSMAAPAGEVLSSSGSTALGQVTDTATGFELAPSEIVPGTRLVQLGAFDSADQARGEWQRLSQRYPDFFLGRARVIEEAATGGQRFFRLRAHGFADLEASRRFCTALVAQGAACIPVTAR